MWDIVSSKESESQIVWLKQNYAGGQLYWIINKDWHQADASVCASGILLHRKSTMSSKNDETCCGKKIWGLFGNLDLKFEDQWWERDKHGSICVLMTISIGPGIHGSECWRNQPGFGWHTVSQKLRAIQYYRDLNIIILKLWCFIMFYNVFKFWIIFL